VDPHWRNASPYLSFARVWQSFSGRYELVQPKTRADLPTVVEVNSTSGKGA
jgi:hypothetical protein